MWAVKYGGLQEPTTCLAEHKAPRKTKPNLCVKLYPTPVCVCLRQAALEDSVTLSCVFIQRLAQQSPNPTGAPKYRSNAN